MNGLTLGLACIYAEFPLKTIAFGPPKNSWNKFWSHKFSLKPFIPDIFIAWSLISPARPCLCRAPISRETGKLNFGREIKNNKMLAVHKIENWIRAKFGPDQNLGLCPSFTLLINCCAHLGIFLMHGLTFGCQNRPVLVYILYSCTWTLCELLDHQRH